MIFGEVVKYYEEFYGMLIVEVLLEVVYGIIKWLYEDGEMVINFLILLGVVYYLNDKGWEIVVVYYFYLFVYNFCFCLKVFFFIEKLEIVFIMDIYIGVNWQEWEIYDFYGVEFIGYLNLVCILNEDFMDYFLMCKEYYLEDVMWEDKDDCFFGR